MNRAVAVNAALDAALEVVWTRMLEVFMPPWYPSRCTSNKMFRAHAAEVLHVK